jgi:uncharacterized membrane protein YphA (DoxX/SURF4 family)
MKAADYRYFLFAISNLPYYDASMISRVRDLILSAWIYRILRVLYAFLFLYAGVNKLFNPRAFAAVIDAFGLVPDILIMPIAVTLPLLEIMAAVGLLLDVRFSLGVVVSLLVFFLAVVSYGIWMGLDIDCGCFGPGDPEGEAYKSLRPALYRNIALLAGAVYLYYWRLKRACEPVRPGCLFQRFASGRKNDESGERVFETWADGCDHGRTDFGGFCKRQVRN